MRTLDFCLGIKNDLFKIVLAALAMIFKNGHFPYSFLSILTKKEGKARAILPLPTPGFIKKDLFLPRDIRCRRGMYLTW
jgi:hypothetical protein